MVSGAFTTLVVYLSVALSAARADFEEEVTTLPKAQFEAAFQGRQHTHLLLFSFSVKILAVQEFKFYLALRFKRYYFE